MLISSKTVKTSKSINQKTVHHKIDKKIFTNVLTSLFVFGILSYVEIALAKPWDFHYGGSSSVVERQIVDLVVEGSNPFFHPLLSSERHALVAQRIERRTSNPQVAGSSPAGRKTWAASSAGRAADS